jgi:Major Facilitator Superfamily
VGKGLRSAPRDAMLAASVPAEQRGAAFGLHRSLDHAGAAIGPLVAALLLWAWTDDVRVVFLAATIPGLLAAFTVLGTREVPPTAAAAAPTRAGREPWRLLLPVAIATLGTASDTFLLYKIGVEDGAERFVLPLLWMGLHVVRMGAAGPGGWLADRIDPVWVAAGGWLWRSAVFLGLSLTAATSTGTGLSVALAMAVGLSAAAEPAERKLVAAWVGRSGAGTAFGGYHAVTGLAALPAGIGFGLLTDTFGAGLAYQAAAATLLVAVFTLVGTVGRRG